jgi:hypothetical protein
MIWGRTKPPLGTPLNWGNPLSRGLVDYLAFLEGSGFPSDSVPGGKVVGVLGTGPLIWGTTSHGMGPSSRGESNGNPYYYTAGNLISGLGSWTIGSHFWVPAAGLNTNASLGLNRWESGNTYLLNRCQGSDIRCIAAMSGSNADLTVTHGFTPNAVNSVVWRLTNGTLNCFVNGVKNATTASGSGTQTSNSTWYHFTSLDTASQYNLSPGRAVSSAAWMRAITDSEAIQFSLNPWCLFARPNSIRVDAPAAPTGRFRRLDMDGGFPAYAGGV